MKFEHCAKFRLYYRVLLVLMYVRHSRFHFKSYCYTCKFPRAVKGRDQPISITNSTPLDLPMAE